jgi:hypothetical protein
MAGSRAFYELLSTNDPATFLELSLMNKNARRAVSKSPGSILPPNTTVELRDNHYMFTKADNSTWREMEAIMEKPPPQNMVFETISPQLEQIVSKIEDCSVANAFFQKKVDSLIKSKFYVLEGCFKTSSELAAVINEIQYDPRIQETGFIVLLNGHESARKSRLETVQRLLGAAKTITLPYDTQKLGSYWKTKEINENTYTLETLLLKSKPVYAQFHAAAQKLRQYVQHDDPGFASDVLQSAFIHTARHLIAEGYVNLEIKVPYVHKGSTFDPSNCR